MIGCGKRGVLVSIIEIRRQPETTDDLYRIIGGVSGCRARYCTSSRSFERVVTKAEK